MDEKAMNDYEKAQLHKQVKSEIRGLFEWFEEKLYSNSISISGIKMKHQLEEIEPIELVAYVLGANSAFIKVECKYNNEFFEGDNYSGKFFIYGDAKIDMNLENVISLKPSSKFTYEYEQDVSEYPADYSNSLISHITLSDINMYRGTFSYTGIINEEHGVWWLY